MAQIATAVQNINLRTLTYPILTEYNFPTRDPSKPAFRIQKLTCALMSVNPRAYNLNDIGTGKTRCSLWTFDYLQSKKIVNKMLVIAPLSTLIEVWGMEIRREFWWLKFEILHGTRDQRLKALNTHTDIYVINHHGLNIILPELLARTDIDVVTVDELDTYSNGRSKTLTLPLKEYVAPKTWVWGMTGSPCPRSVTDVWGPCSCISPWTIPKFFSHFRNMLQVPTFGFNKWENRPGAEEKAVACMRPSVRFKLSDVIELPPRILQYYEAPLSPKVAKIYKEMSTKAVILVQNHTIDAQNAGAVMSKLLQISLGYVYTRDGAIVELDNKSRLQLIIDLIDSCAYKIILFAPFIHALNGLHNTLESNKITHCIVHGSVTMKQRSVLFDQFRNTNNYKVLLAHPRCMSHGLTLTEATMIIWAGPPLSLKTFYQANGRIYRVGQQHKTLIAMIGGTNREQTLYKLLGNNERVQQRFLQLIETEQ